MIKRGESVGKGGLSGAGTVQCKDLLHVSLLVSYVLSSSQLSGWD